MLDSPVLSIMPRVGRKKLRSQDGDCRDRISNLPDHLLVSILKLMDSREAAATGALSKRWRHVWESLTKFNFDARYIKHRSYYRLRKALFDRNRLLCNSRSNRLLNVRSGTSAVGRTLKKYKQRAMREFRKSVSGFLGWCDRLNVESLRLNFFMIPKYASFIDRCVSVAVGENTRDLEIKNLDEMKDLSKDKSYTFPIWLFSNGRGSSLTKLSIGGCKLQIPPEFHGFVSVAKLSLVGVHLENEHISNLLCSCKHLESLLLHDCSGFDLIDINSSVSCLKYLTVFSCIDKIQICSTKLQELSYIGDFIPLTFEHAPCLESMRLDYCNGRRRGAEYMLGKLSRDHPQITTLRLSFGEPRTWIMPIHPPAPFRKLKVLILSLITHETTDLLRISLLLEAAPILQTLGIYLYPGKKPRRAGTVWHPSNFRHSCLKTVKIFYFRGMQNEIDLGRFVLERAVFLESLTFTSEALCEDILLPSDIAKTSQAQLWSPKERLNLNLLILFTLGISTNARIVIE